jgi:hypothetical protein
VQDRCYYPPHGLREFWQRPSQGRPANVRTFADGLTRWNTHSFIFFGEPWRSDVHLRLEAEVHATTTLNTSLVPRSCKRKCDSLAFSMAALVRECMPGSLGCRPLNALKTTHPQQFGLMPYVNAGGQATLGNRRELMEAGGDRRKPTESRRKPT